MTLLSQIASALTDLGTAIKTNRLNVGDLASLATGTKTSIVAALNELKGLVDDAAESGGATSLDELTDVAIVAPATGHLIRYNGTGFVNVLGTNHFDVTGSAAAAQAASQPLDADLTEIAAQGTTAFGRSVLNRADAAALTALLVAATAAAPGIVELATTSEAVAASDQTRAVTPAGLQAFLEDFIGAAPADLNEWAELVNAIQAGEDDVAALMTAVNGKQAQDATLSALAALTVAANQLVYATAADTFATTAFTAHGRTLVGSADAAATRNTLSVYSKADIGDLETSDLQGVVAAALA